MKTCGFTGCPRPARVRGLCKTHWQQQKRGSELTPIRERGTPQTGPCGYEDCYDDAVCRGYCRRHYMAAKRSGILDGINCGFEGCSEYAVTRGFCPGHYEQYRRGRSLSPLKEKNRPMEERLLERRRVDPDTGCWIWEGAADLKGYGHLQVRTPDGRGTTARTHRLAYAAWVGPVGTATVHHKCATRLCFNPEHLELATNRDNVAEMFERRALKARIAELEAEVAALRQRVA